MTLTKIEAARRQLITSIRLLFEDADSVSVYTLAHASWEVLDALCKHEGKVRFRDQMASATGKGEKAIKEIAKRKAAQAFEGSIDPDRYRAAKERRRHEKLAVKYPHLVRT